MKLCNWLQCFLAVSLNALGAFALIELPELSANPSKEEWLELARMGGGYIPIPEGLKQYIQPSVDYANLVPLHKNKEELKQQHEMIYLSKPRWSFFPEETQKLLHGMSALSIEILRELLNALELDPSLFAQVTGGLTDDKGINDAKILYYNPAKPGPGISKHKDIRFITLLFFNQPGLQGIIGEEVFDIAPREGYFVVNIGVFLEALFNDETRVTALIHQVRHLDVPRISIASLNQGNLTQNGFYQLEDGQPVWRGKEDMERFLVKDVDRLFLLPEQQIFSSIGQ